MKLTENEKRDAIKLIEADKPLPDKYRFLLFDSDRKVELIWNGKTSEVCNVVLPFQVIEQVATALANGKNKIVVENGRIVKIIKDRKGIVTCEILTRHQCH